MNDGKVEEVGEPRSLVYDQNSEFYKFVSSEESHQLRSIRNIYEKQEQGEEFSE